MAASIVIQRFAKAAQQWMDELAPRYAAELLRSSSVSVKEIATKLGYKFPGNFATQCKVRYRRVSFVDQNFTIISKADQGTTVAGAI